jgi:hypothetical protein
MTFITNMVLRPWAREEGVPHILASPDHRVLYCGRPYHPEDNAYVGVPLWSKLRKMKPTELSANTCSQCRRLHDSTEGAAH